MLPDEASMIYYQGYCDCIFFDEYEQQMVKTLLRPGTYSFYAAPAPPLTRTEYCENVLKGTLANCKS